MSAGTDGGSTTTMPSPAVRPPTEHNPDLYRLVGRNGFSIIGAVTFLLSIPSSTNSYRFAEIHIGWGYCAVTVFAMCGFIVLGGLEKVNVKSIAALMIQVVVVCIFATPPLFAIWDSARLRAPDSAIGAIAQVTPHSPANPFPKSSDPTPKMLPPFSLEVK
ncbi:hypothetical protein GR198_20645 [Rhizobium leguminosarum]|uniref:hypothetical protein n=1 Tax=Rhizobium leguminosarum TaxID=384 RepID=UPI0013C010A2|nr:hypothetical protein [Rhizobium leguminosarum]NEH58133.1 hypothetical protein [Rhizobium leguminosarum]